MGAKSVALDQDVFVMQELLRVRWSKSFRQMFLVELGSPTKQVVSDYRWSKRMTKPDRNSRGKNLPGKGL